VKPLFSELVDSTANSGISKHQQETWDLLSDPTIDAVINTAMTGDGKSYAAFGAFPEGGVMALYPTNELVRDQQRQLANYQKELRVQRVTGSDLEQWARSAKQSKAETLLDLSNTDILLTNPDLFYYLHQGNYLKDFLRRCGGDRLDLWRQIDNNFKAIVFDEFHLYNPSQVSGVLNTILLMRSVGINHKLVFLSATPHKHLIKCLELAGLNYRVVKGKYSDFPRRGCRQISQPFTLDLKPIDRGEAWLQENQEELLEFFLENPGSKGAIILNSIATVKRVSRSLKKLFAAHDLTVAENTGFTDKTESETAINGDLIVGTSTLDVGVDFRINYLLFEGHDAPSFIQRLGRLGRHAGFSTYHAIGFVPRYFAERMGLVCPDEVDRVQLNKLVLENHRKVNSFAKYFERWSPVQAIVVGQQLAHPDLNGEYKQDAEYYLNQCRDLYGEDFANVRNQIMEWKQEAQSLRTSNLIVQEARSFRGTSSLQAAVIDSMGGIDRFTTYSLPGILSNYQYRVLSSGEFGKGAPSFVQHCTFHFKVISLLEKRRYWNFYLDEWKAQKLSGKIRILTGLATDNDGSGNQLSLILKRVQIVAFIVAMRADDLKLKLRLPLHFPLYDLKTRPDDRYHIYSIAFDQAALMLDAYLGKGDVIDRDMIAMHSRQVFQSEIDDDAAFLAKYHQQFASDLLQEDLNGY
jgi:CRISPR-associated endonuclease/helicase Cas3